MYVERKMFNLCKGKKYQIEYKFLNKLLVLSHFT